MGWHESYQMRCDQRFWIWKKLRKEMLRGGLSVDGYCHSDEALAELLFNEDWF